MLLTAKWVFDTECHFLPYRIDLFQPKTLCVTRDGLRLCHSVPKVVVRRKSLWDQWPLSNVLRDFPSFRCSRDINGTLHWLMLYPVVIWRELQGLRVGKIHRCSIAIAGRILSKSRTRLHFPLRFLRFVFQRLKESYWLWFVFVLFAIEAQRKCFFRSRRVG